MKEAWWEIVQGGRIAWARGPAPTEKDRQAASPLAWGGVGPDLEATGGLPEGDLAQDDLAATALAAGWTQNWWETGIGCGEGVWAMRTGKAVPGRGWEQRAVGWQETDPGGKVQVRRLCESRGGTLADSCLCIEGPMGGGAWFLQPGGRGLESPLGRGYLVSRWPGVAAPRLAWGTACWTSPVCFADNHMRLSEPSLDWL